MKQNFERNVSTNSQAENAAEVLETSPLSSSFLEFMPPAIKTSYEKARKIKRKKRIRMSGGDFANYADLQQDLAKVRTRIQEIDSKEKRGVEEAIAFGEIFEGVLTETTWFGEDSTVMIPSLYDDLYLGNDLLLEHSVNDGVYKAYASMGVDLTVGEEASLHKMEDTRRRLLKGNLGSVKYFKSPNSNFVGQLNNLPHFVVGLDRKHISELAALWSENKIEEINNNPIQLHIFNQMKMQIQYFSSLIRDRRDKLSRVKNLNAYDQATLSKYDSCIEVYEQELIKINSLIAEKEQKLNLKMQVFVRNQRQSDGVSNTLDSYVRSRNGMPDNLNLS